MEAEKDLGRIIGRLRKKENIDQERESYKRSRQTTATDVQAYVRESALFQDDTLVTTRCEPRAVGKSTLVTPRTKAYSTWLGKAYGEQSPNG